MLHTGTCPKCEQGVRGVRTCGREPVLMCDECEAVWCDPADASPVFPPQPDLPSPRTGRSLLGPEAHWCTRAEVEAAGWGDAIEGEVESREPAGSIDPLPTYFEGDERLAAWRAAADDRVRVVAQGDPETEAVVLAGDLSRHGDQIETALESKKHVLASLPWGDITGTRHLVSLAEEQHRTLAPLLTWPHHPRTRTIRGVIDDGQIGPVRRVIIGRSESDNAGIEPLLLNSVLVAMWACDATPTSGSTTALTADAATLTLEFDDAVVLIDVSDDLPKRQWVEIVGTRGSIVCDDLFDAPAGEASRFWVHDAAGQSTTHTVPPCDGRQETLATLFRHARTGHFDAGESVADATEVVYKLLNQDHRPESA